jgi:hypothetical protein
MKLTNLLSQIILEEGEGTIPVAHFVHDGFLITLKATYHQWKERQGTKSLGDIVAIYEDNFVNNPKFYERVGVPNKMIKDIFINEFSTIKKRMSKLSLVRPNNTVIFAKEVGESLDLPQYMDFVEIILLTEDLKNYKIITSVFSENGTYLKKFGKNQNSPRFFLDS